VRLVQSRVDMSLERLLGEVAPLRGHHGIFDMTVFSGSCDESPE
jgi:hypothetical protein